jgi:ribosomal protein L14
VFHLYKGFNRKKTKISFFIKGSVRKVEPPRVEYKGFKFKFNLKGDICRGLLIRTVYQSVVADGTVKKFKYNNVVLIKKKQQFKSKYLYGPVPLEIKRKKIISLFPLVI